MTFTKGRKLPKTRILNLTLLEQFYFYNQITDFFFSRCLTVHFDWAETRLNIWSCFSPISCFFTSFPYWFPWCYTRWSGECCFPNPKASFLEEAPEIHCQLPQHKRPTSLAFRFEAKLSLSLSKHICITIYSISFWLRFLT